MREQERKEWPKAYRWHQDEDDVIILHHEDEHVFCAMGFEWWYAKVLSENADSVANTGKPCWIEADAPESAIRIADELTQLRTQLADARRIISELEAAQGIAVHELKRLRELAKARLRTIKHLNETIKKLKSEVAVLTELEHRARWPGEYA